MENLKEKLKFAGRYLGGRALIFLLATCNPGDNQNFCKTGEYNGMYVEIKSSPIKHLILTKEKDSYEYLYASCSKRDSKKLTEIGLDFVPQGSFLEVYATPDSLMKIYDHVMQHGNECPCMGGKK